VSVFGAWAIHDFQNNILTSKGYRRILKTSSAFDRINTATITFERPFWVQQGES